MENKNVNQKPDFSKQTDKESLSRKVGDKIERVGEKIRDLGDKIEHRDDRK